MARLDDVPLRRRKTRSLTRKTLELAEKSRPESSPTPSPTKKPQLQLASTPTPPPSLVEVEQLNWTLMRAMELVLLAQSQSDATELLRFQALFPSATLTSVATSFPTLVARLTPQMRRSGCDVCFQNQDCPACNVTSQLASVCSQCGVTLPSVTKRSSTTDIENAALRGLNALVKISRQRKNLKDFDAHGGDVLFLFRYIVTHSPTDSVVREKADEALQTILRQWESRHPSLALSDPPEKLLVFAEATHAKLGLQDTRPKEAIRELQECLLNVSLADLISFSPRAPRPPLLPPGHCTNCSRRNIASAVSCARCSRTISSTTTAVDYESVCFAIVWSALFEELGLRLEGVDKVRCSVSDVLALMPWLRPYGGVEAIGESAFKAQGYFITHLLFVMSGWGRYRLESQLFAEELAFLSSQLNTCVRLGDPELVGEFLQCLRLLGVQENDYPVRRGVKYLLSREKSLKCKGQWVKPGKKFFQHYHAIYCALIGLLPLQIDQDASLMPSEWRRFFLQKNPTNAKNNQNNDNDDEVQSSTQV